MRYWLYNMAITLATPIGAGYLAASARHRPSLGRFYPRVPALPASPIWVHACSVGEVAVAQPLLNALAEQYPTIPRLLTTSTATGRARAESMNLDCGIAWFPFDHPLSVSHFLRQANPRLLILIETELWPNVLRLTTQRGIPAVLVNGRLSDRHFHRYQRSRHMVPDMMSRLAFACVQDETYSDRFAALGMPRDQIHVTGNLKFDGVPNPPADHARDALRERCGIPADAPVIVFGSTRPGDEQLALETWHALRNEWPNAHIIIAPRHVERVPEIVKLFSEPVQLKTRMEQDPPSQVLIVDTHGELLAFYSIATVAVVGGSFDSAIQGHNPIEPAAMGVPAIVGPHMRNFAAATESLVRANAALSIDGPEKLQAELVALLRDFDRQSHMGDQGKSVVAANRGALQRTLDVLDARIFNTQPEVNPE